LVKEWQNNDANAQKQLTECRLGMAKSARRIAQLLREKQRAEGALTCRIGDKTASAFGWGILYHIEAQKASILQHCLRRIIRMREEATIAIHLDDRAKSVVDAFVEDAEWSIKEAESIQ
jgi:hypothetical protein